MTAQEGGQDVLLQGGDDGIIRIAINRPHARNALSFTVWEGLAEVLDRLERATPPRALILYGEGGFFSAGGDIKVPPSRGDGALARAARVELAQRVIHRLRAFPAPTIAAVEGMAIGLGWSLVLACDMIVAARDARFQAPFASMGIVPDGGLVWFLTRHLGRYRAAEIMFGGRIVEATEAQCAGLTTQLTEPGQTLDAASAIAAALGAGNRKAVELIKRLMHQAETADLGVINATELAYCEISQAGEEAAAARRKRQIGSDRR